MRKMINLFSSSYQELKNLRCLTLLGIFGAISIVLGYLSIVPIDTVKITFSFLPNEFIYYLFGPFVGIFFGAAMDLLTFIIKPAGPYFFGFTLSSVLTGLYFGLILYKRPISLVRLMLANAVYLLTFSLLLDTYWLTLLYGYDFMAILPARLLKIAIMFPVKTLLLFFVVKGVESTGIVRAIRSKEAHL